MPENHPLSDPWQDKPHEVIVCNFGGPTCAEEVEPFLRRLFEDPFIIRALFPEKFRQWLAKRISAKRAPRLIEEYRSIGFSPINKLTEIQANRLEHLLRAKRPQTRVHVVNRYTAPFAQDIVKQLDFRHSRMFMLTLYPHICHSTTVSSLRDFDLAFIAEHGSTPVSSVRIFSWWHNPRFLNYSFTKLRAGLEKALAHSSDKPLTVMFSAHGIPLRYDRRGDPYVNETRAHFAALQQRGIQWLKQHAGGAHAQRVHWALSFQSRVGRVEWVKPYTDDMLCDLGKTRGGHLLMVPISFTSDHIETLYEMDVTYKSLALEQGFQTYDRVIPPNEDEEFTHCLYDILAQHGF